MRGVLTEYLSPSKARNLFHQSPAWGAYTMSLRRSDCPRLIFLTWVKKRKVRTSRICSALRFFIQLYLVRIIPEVPEGKIFVVKSWFVRGCK